jgi:tetratricopeptide (TPR) repeat protein
VLRNRAESTVSSRRRLECARKFQSRLHYLATPASSTCSGVLWADSKERDRLGDGSDRSRVEEGEEQKTLLDAMHGLGMLYVDQGKLDEAEQMYERALRGYEARGPTYTSTLDSIHCLGILYADQGKLGEAEQMFERALRGYEEALGPTHVSTLDMVNNLGLLYKNQGRLGEAEHTYTRALRGYEEALDHEQVQQYSPALNTLENLGDLYLRQAETDKARIVYAQALSGLSCVLGQSSDQCIDLAAETDALSVLRTERAQHLSLQAVGEKSNTQRDSRKMRSSLLIRNLIRKVF